MRRGTETILRRTLMFGAAAMLAGAIAISYQTFAIPVEAPRLNLTMPSEPPSAPKRISPLDPGIAKLSSTKMTRTIAPVIQKIEIAAKPPTPKLESFLRVKGIMDTGNAKTTEAIIEILREGKTRFVRVGEVISEANATVAKIDGSVVFLYDGKNVLLQVNGETGIELPADGRIVGLRPNESDSEKVRVP